MQNVFVITVVAFFLDVILSATWNSTYFLFGVLAYKKSYRIKGKTLDDLPNNIRKDGDHITWARYKIKQVDNRTFLLRKNLWYFGFSFSMPIIRWRIKVHDNGQYFSLTALYQFYPIVLLLGIGTMSVPAFITIVSIFVAFFILRTKLGVEPFHNAEVEKICGFIRN